MTDSTTTWLMAKLNATRTSGITESDLIYLMPDGADDVISNTICTLYSYFIEEQEYRRILVTSRNIIDIYPLLEGAGY